LYCSRGKLREQHIGSFVGDELLGPSAFSKLSAHGNSPLAVAMAWESPLLTFTRQMENGNE
jgi:hypothetical protein